MRYNEQVLPILFLVDANINFRKKQNNIPFFLLQEEVSQKHCGVVGPLYGPFWQISRSCSRKIVLRRNCLSLIVNLPVGKTIIY